MFVYYCYSYWGPLLVHNMCLVRPVLLYLNVRVLKVFYGQIKWMNNASPCRSNTITNNSDTLDFVLCCHHVVHSVAHLWTHGIQQRTKCKKYYLKHFFRFSCSSKLLTVITKMSPGQHCSTIQLDSVCHCAYVGHMSGIIWFLSSPLGHFSFLFAVG